MADPGVQRESEFVIPRNSNVVGPPVVWYIGFTMNSKSNLVLRKNGYPSTFGLFDEQKYQFRQCHQHRSRG
jgi:hypothetical protein